MKKILLLLNIIFSFIFTGYSQCIPGVIGTDETICVGTAISTITEISAPTGAPGTYTYQWQSGASETFTDIPNATNATYSPFALTNTTQFRRVETSGTCGTVISNVITKIVSPILVTSVAIIDPGQACSGTILMFKATPVNAGLAPSYQWYMNTNTGEHIPVGTNSDTYIYTTASEDNGKYITVKIIPSETCSPSAISNAAFLSIRPSVTPIVIIPTPQNPICEGFPISFNAIAANGGATPTYQWYVIPSGSTVASTVGTEYSSYSSASLHNGDQVYVELISSLICAANNPATSNIVTTDIRPIPTPSQSPKETKQFV